MKHTIHKWGAISYQFMRLLDPHIRRPNQNRVKPVGTKSQVSLKIPSKRIFPLIRVLYTSPRLGIQSNPSILMDTYIYHIPHTTVQHPSMTCCIHFLEYTIPPLSSVLLCHVLSCAMDLGNRGSYHRSAGVNKIFKKNLKAA